MTGEKCNPTALSGEGWGGGKMVNHRNGSVIVVDDDLLMLESVSILLRKHGFAVRAFGDADSALAEFAAHPADLVLTDIHMPFTSGIQLLERLRRIDTETPVVFMTAHAEMEMTLLAIKMRAFDFILRPFPPQRLIEAVTAAVHHKRHSQREKIYRSELEKTIEQRTNELADSLRVQKSISKEIVERLTAAAELRDEDTGQHISRIGLYAERLARELGMSDDFCETIGVASAMHDIGKIGIPDAILFKPQSLTAEEFEIIKTHTVIGNEILRCSSHPLLQMAASIALTHHESWDGSGYPHGLKREEIPVEGRIVMLADQYDALRSKRAYKAPLDHETACRIILEGDALTRREHFDPEVLQVFREIAADLAEIFDRDREGRCRKKATTRPAGNLNTIVDSRSLPASIGS